MDEDYKYLVIDDTFDEKRAIENLDEETIRKLEANEEDRKWLEKTRKRLGLI